MKNLSQIDRLLRAAAVLPNEQPAELPFGFETRVVARWRAVAQGEFAGVNYLLRRVMLMAVAVIVLGSAGAYREVSAGDEQAEPLHNDYAIADTAIGGAFEQ